jgi:CTP synthase
MQCAVIEFARNVLQLPDANSSEFSADTQHPVICLLEGQKGIQRKGGTMRLGSQPCTLATGSHAAEAYGRELIHERHRHRYEFNPEYRNDFAAAGMQMTGVNPESGLVEIIELPAHPWFLAVQYHPEFKSQPHNAHPLFKGFVEAALTRRQLRTGVSSESQVGS